jgi:hypothetical protein
VLGWIGENEVESIVAVAVVLGSGVIFLDARDDGRFGLHLRGKGYYCCCSAGDGTSRACSEVISGGTIVLGEVNMAVDAAGSDVGSSCIDYLSIFTPGEKHPQTRNFAIFYSDLDFRRKHLAGCDLRSFSRDSIH